MLKSLLSISLKKYVIFYAHTKSHIDDIFKHSIIILNGGCSPFYWRIIINDLDGARIIEKSGRSILISKSIVLVNYSGKNFLILPLIDPWVKIDEYLSMPQIRALGLALNN